MERNEITDFLRKMNALVESEGGLAIDPHGLMQDPIVANRLAVELLQQVDRDSKPEAVLAPQGAGSYFGYSVALAAWMRFVYAGPAADGEGLALAAGAGLSKKEKVLVVLDSYDEELACALVGLAKEAGANPLAVLSVTPAPSETAHGCRCLSLL